MKRFDADIGSANRALEQAPKILDSVRVHVASHIRFHVIDDVGRVLFFESDVRGKFIGEKLTFRFDDCADFSLNRFRRRALNYFRSNLADCIASVTL